MLPALAGAFPHFRETFARSARHAAQAQQVLEEVAREDMARSSRASDSGLIVASVQIFSRARQANLVRHWLKATYGAVPSAAQLDELLGQIAVCTTRGHNIHIKVANGFVQRRREVLAWYDAESDPGVQS